MVVSTIHRSPLGEFNRSSLGERGSITGKKWFWALFSDFKSSGTSSFPRDHYFVFDELGGNHVDEIPKSIVSFRDSQMHPRCGWERSSHRPLPRELFGLLRRGEDDWVAFKPYDPNFVPGASVERGQISVASGIGGYTVTSTPLIFLPDTQLTTGWRSQDFGAARKQSGFAVDLVDMRDAVPHGDTPLFSVQDGLLLTGGALGSLDTPAAGAECHYRCRDQGLFGPAYRSSPAHATYPLDSRAVPGQQRTTDWFADGWAETQDVDGYIARLGVAWPFAGSTHARDGNYSSVLGSYAHTATPAQDEEWVRADVDFSDTYQGGKKFISDHPISEETEGAATPSTLAAIFSQSRNLFNVEVTSALERALLIGSIVGDWFTWTHTWKWLVLFLQQPVTRTEPSVQLHVSEAGPDVLAGSAYEDVGPVAFGYDDDEIAPLHGIKADMYERIFCDYVLPDSPQGQYQHPSGAVAQQSSAGPAFEEVFSHDDSGRAAGVPSLEDGDIKTINKAVPQVTRYKDEVVWFRTEATTNHNIPRNYNGFYLTSRIVKTMGDVGVATSDPGVAEEKILRVGFPNHGWDTYDLITAGTVVDAIF